MADNYQQYSFMIDKLTPTEVTWLETKFNESNKDPDAEYTGEMQIEKRTNGADLWLHEEEGADLECLAEFLQAFLKENRPDSHIDFEWANTCSKPRLNEFGGGALFITADRISGMSTYSFCEEKRIEFEDKEIGEAKPPMYKEAK